MTVYSSHSFPTSPAGSGAATVPISHGKATVALGLGLPSDVLVTSVQAHPGAGLGIFIDSWFPDDSLSEQSEEPGSSPAMPSPPLLAVRRSPRKPPADTPGAEAAPMRTPDPSLRGVASGEGDGGGYFVLALPAPSAPTLPSTPALPPGPFEGTGGAGVGLGLGTDSLELNGSEFASSFREVVEDTSARAPLVGLGLSLPCLDEAELITTLEAQSTAMHGSLVDIDLSFLEDDALSDLEDDSSLPSPWSRAASSDIVSCAVETMHPRPARAYKEVRFALDGEFDGESQCGPDGASPRASPDESTLGFDSPFWTMYASVLYEE